jgi:hypothetical protein
MRGTRKRLGRTEGMAQASRPAGDGSLGKKLSGEGSPANMVSWSMSAKAPSPAPRKHPHRSPTKICARL